MDTDKYTIPKGSLISFFSNKVKQFGGINLAQGIPGYSPPKELLAILSNIALNKNIHQYAPGNGNANLVNKIEEVYKSELNLTNENILVVQGATEAGSLIYTYLKSIFKSSFATMAFLPVYEMYNNIPQIFGDNFIGQSFLPDGSIDFENFENNIVTNNVRLLFLSSPGNPWGRVFSKEEILTIVELSHKHSFYIIFDAVYRDYSYNKSIYIPNALENNKFFYVNSFSKKISITGWRVGYIICNNEHMKRIRAIHDYTGLCVGSVQQEAIAEYFNKHNFGNEYIKNKKEMLISAYNYAVPKLIKAGFTVPESNGGYFIWTQLPPTLNDGFKFGIDLYEQENTAIIPGIHFSPNAKNYIRINIAREKDELERGINAILSFIEKHTR